MTAHVQLCSSGVGAHRQLHRIARIGPPAKAPRFKAISRGTFPHEQKDLIRLIGKPLDIVYG